jgi:hypothetical protein
MYNGMVIKKELIYPFFLHCIQYTEDIFWKNIFEDLSYGICPYGTYINKDFLTCSYPGKEFSYKILKKSPKILFNEIYNLLTKKLGILSNIEKDKKRKKFNEIEEEIGETKKTWCDIKKKNIKDMIIEKYTIDMKKKHKLSDNNTKKLLSIIIIALLFKTITSKDIVYKEGKILEIKGINFKNDNIILNKKINQVEYSLNAKIIIEDKLMSTNWDKFIVQLEKNTY